MSLIKKIRNNVFKIIHSGSECYCFFCNKSYGKFIHGGVKSDVFRRYKVAGGGFKRNVRCPNCQSGCRARLLALFFKLRTDVFKKETSILHISPNKRVANLLRESKTINHVVGALEPDQFAEYSPIEIDVQKMNLKDSEYDVVICCHVLEHVDKDEKAMREIYRVLKPGGFAILQVPIALNLDTTIENKLLKTDKERKEAFGQIDHIRLYGKDYFKKLEKAGFEVLRDNPFENCWLDNSELEKHRLDIIEDIIVATKN